MTKNNHPKIVFFGTPEFAVRILDILDQADLAPILIITTPDKPHGRGLKLLPSPTKLWAQERQIDVWQPNKLRDPEFLNKLQALSPDLFVVASYGKIMPQELLDIPHSSTINVHPSLLPLYRGPAPIEGAIIAGDAESGVTIMLVDAEMDHGPILAQKKLPMTIVGLKFLELEKRLAELGGKMLADVIPRWLAGTITPREQNHSLATFTKKVGKEDGHIDWQMKTQEILCRILALNPWPGTYSFFDHDGSKERLIVAEATLLPKEALSAQPRKTGEIFEYASAFGVTTQDGALLILRVKPEGKKEMAATEYLRGHRDLMGKILH